MCKRQCNGQRQRIRSNSGQRDACDAGVTPYVVTKKTVFKWQETFWQKMRCGSAFVAVACCVVSVILAGWLHSTVFDEHYREKFRTKGLLKRTGGELCHFLSDVASMQVRDPCTVQHRFRAGNTPPRSVKHKPCNIAKCNM